MSIRNFFFAVSLCVAASVAVGQGNQGSGLLTQTLTPVNGGGTLVVYNANGNPLSPSQLTGPTGLSGILPTPDGTKVYLIGSSGVSPLVSYTLTFGNPPSLTNPHPISLNGPSGLTTTPSAAVITPNGQYLLVGATDSAGASYIFTVDTATDLPRSGSGVSIQLPGTPGPAALQASGCPTCWIAVSRDSQTAYILTNSPSGNQVTTYSLTSFQPIGTAQSTTSYATSIALSPQGLLYVTGGNKIWVYDPSQAGLPNVNTISGTFNFSPLQFTSDGTTAYSINQAPTSPPLSAASLAQVNLSTGAISYWPPQSGGQQGPQLNSVFVAGNSKVFAYSASLTTLYDIAPNPLNGTPSQATAPLSSAASLNVLAAAISNEVPSSRYLFVLIANGSQPFLSRIDLTTGLIDVTQGSPGLSTGLMQFAGVPVQTGAATILQFNNPQIVKSGQTSMPLIGRVLDSAGRPVYKLPVTFSIDTGTGILINNPSPITNADGYVQTTATVPAGGATCTNSACNITLTAGTITSTYTLTVPGSGGTTGGGGGGGGGGGTAPSQVNIVSGNGQLVLTGSGATFPLVVQVTDTSGKPLANIPVSFTLTGGNSGSIGLNTVPTTDKNGMASATFFAQAIGQGLAYENNFVTAQTQYGPVTFTETTFAVTNLSLGSGLPEIDLLAPDLATKTVVTPGAPTVGAIQARVFSTTQGSQPIPGVGVVLSDSTNPGAISQIVSCKGSPLSDVATGIVSCDLVASCSAQQGNYSMQIYIGGYTYFDRPFTITSSNAASQIALTSGNNQSGGVGKKLAQPLVATITNGCAQAVTGAVVSWTVKGSATLVDTKSSSDSAGNVSTNITFGSTPGAVTVTATLSGIGVVTFTLTNQVVVNGITLLSGNNQSANFNQTFQPLVFQVLDVNHNPVSGLPVTFTGVNVAGYPATTTTNASGQATTTPTAGLTAGAASVTATAAGFTATANLTITPPGPSITSNSFVNAASSAIGLVPCGLGTVTGAGIAAAVNGVVSGVSPFLPFPYSLGGFSMAVNGVSAPIESVSNQGGVQQANFQTPCETQPGLATVVVTINGVNTTFQNVQVLQAQPGIFTFQGPTGKPYGAVVRALDGSYVTPTNFARRGETYYLVVTGLGQTNPPVATNSFGIAGLNVVPQMVVGVSNIGVQVVSQQYLVGSIGVYLVGFQIPLTAPTGPDQPLAVAAIVGTTPVYGNPVYLPGVQ